MHYYPFHLVKSNLTCALMMESACQQVYASLWNAAYLYHECALIIYDWSPLWLQICLSLYVKTEENTVMKEALGKMKKPKEKNMCWQDGRLFDDKEDWVVDSCTKCTCQVVPSHVEIWTDSPWMSMILIYVFHSFMAGVQDCVSPNHMPPSGLCQPVIYRRRVLPSVFA